MDRDGVREKISHQPIRIDPKTAQISRHVPQNQKDWNSALKAEIKREAELQQKQQKQKSRGRGLSL